MYGSKSSSVLHKVLFIIFHRCIMCKCFFCILHVFVWTLHIYIFVYFIAHQMLCAKLFYFIAYVCFVLPHMFVKHKQ